MWVWVLHPQEMIFIHVVVIAMDCCLPDWDADVIAELPLPSQRRPFGVDNELVELLWQNGEVVLQSQNNKKPNSDPNKPKQTYRDPNNNLMQDDETVSWIHCPIDESFDKEFCSKIFSEIPTSNPILPNNKLASQFQSQSQNMFNFGTSNTNPNFNSNPLPPPRSSSFGGPHEQRNAGFIEEIVDPVKGKGIIRQRSAATIGSSDCGSNQVANDLDLSKAWRDVTEREMQEQPVTSSSGGSGSSSMWKTSNQSNDTSRHKRKSWNMEESECKSDGTESESAAGNKSSQKSGTTRRSRVAEVHNLSERKRRDRINEKMKALQELVPNSNKSDKASVLDEAIEYMKSLQLQLQLMWMGRGMAPMMLPGMQHYMARLGLGIGPPTLPQIQDLMRLSRFPPVINQAMRPATTNPMSNQATFGQNPVNYQNHMLNPSFPEQYANLMGFGPTQNTSQPINRFNLGSNSANNHVLARPSNGNGYIG